MPKLGLLKTALFLFCCLLSAIASGYDNSAKGRTNVASMEPKVKESRTYSHHLSKRQLSGCNFMFFLEPTTAFNCSPTQLNVTCRFYIPSTPNARVAFMWEHGPPQSTLSITTEFTGITNAIYESTLAVSVLILLTANIYVMMLK